MKLRYALSCAGLLLALTRAALGADVVFYKQGDLPDPHRLASILRAPSAPSTPANGKDRGLVLLSEHGASASNAETSNAATSFAIPVQFAFASSRILPDATAQLDVVAEGIKLAGPDVKVIIEGHTDAVGSVAYNVALSRMRAEAVKAYLVAHGIAAANLRVVGMGKSAPLNTSDPYAAENRRVEFRAAAPASANG